MYTQEVENAVKSLLVKYNIPPAGYKDAPLLPWRYNRKFVELFKLIDSGTVEYPCMFRFCAIGDAFRWTIRSLMYREFDLCEFLGNSPVVSVQAVLNKKAGSVIAKLENGIICSVEVGALLKKGTMMNDRHEIIARRGVASDIVVDTQHPQSSIYTFTEEGEKEYKDVDNELYGLSETDVELARSAFEFCKQPTLLAMLNDRHTHLSALVDAAFESDRTKKKVII